MVKMIGGKLEGLISREKLDEALCPFDNFEAEDIALGRNVKFEAVRRDDGEGVRMKHEGEDWLEVSKKGLQHLMHSVSIPASYMARVPMGLVVPHLNLWFGERAKGDTFRLMKREGTVVAATDKTSVDSVRFSEVLAYVEQAVGVANVLGYHKVQLDWASGIVSVVLGRSFEMEKSDVLNAGIRISHSIMGLEPTKLSAYVFRKICANGAVTMDDVEQWSRRNRASTLPEWVTASVGAAQKSFDRESQRLKHLASVKTEKHTSRILDSLMCEAGVPKSLRDEVRKAAIDANVENLYDLYNVLTRVGTHSRFFEKHPNAMMKMEEMAGRLSYDPKLCPSCHRRV